MFLTTSLLLLVVVIAYIVCTKGFKLGVELSLFFSSIAVALAGKIFTELPRHIAEGTTTYMDNILIFLTATMFMNIIKETGGLTYLMKKVMDKLGKVRVLALFFIFVLMMVPGAITGSGSVTVLVIGSIVTMALASMGISKVRICAIVFLLAGLSAVCPPVSMWAMITCAGAAVPYVGFEIPLLVPCVIVGLFTIYLLGIKKSAEPVPFETDNIPTNMAMWRVLVPILVMATLIVIPRFAPFGFPTLGLPLTFAISAAVAYFCAPTKLSFVKISKDTVRQLLPLMGTMAVVGVMMQLFAATGVRGLLAWAVVALPLNVMIALLPIALPFSEGVFGFGGAGILGIPLIWTFNQFGIHATTSLVGLSLLWMLGDALPPTAIIARMAQQVVGYEGPGTYGKLLKTCILPGILTIAIALAYVIWSNEIAAILM